MNRNTKEYIKQWILKATKTHNIEFLLSECAEIDTDFTAIDPGNLSDFGVDVRYPGDMYIPSDKETIEYKETALSVKELVESKLDIILKD